MAPLMTKNANNKGSPKSTLLLHKRKVDLKASVSTSTHRSSKRVKKIHGLANQHVAQSQMRNRMFWFVVIYVGVGAIILIWYGLSTAPEMPPGLDSQIVSSYAKDIKNIEMPQTLKKKSASSQLSSDNATSTSAKDKDLNTTEKFVERIQDRMRFSPIPTKPVARKWEKLQITKNADSSNVEIFKMDNFLSSHECDGLMKAHETHVEKHDRHTPIVCFSDDATMTSYLKQTTVRWATSVSQKDFVAGTLCLNESLSGQLRGEIPWSKSTSFYPGESKFSTLYEQRVHNFTGLHPRSGGKFQVTSYEEGVAYKLHTDCVVGGSEKRDRFATVLVYLNDVDDGGETVFTELGVSVKPKKGMALVWNNMDSRGLCDVTSYHLAAHVKQGKKYILQRWYYYQNFPTLGKRQQLTPNNPVAVSREHPRVMCDYFESGSCRWYDEWGLDHLTDYRAQLPRL